MIPDCKNEKVILSKEGFTLRNGTNKPLIFNVYFKYKTQPGGVWSGQLETDDIASIWPDDDQLIGGIEVGIDRFPSNAPFYFTQCLPEYPHEPEPEPEPSG